MEQNQTLSTEENNFYNRQIILPEIGRSGQIKFKNTSILIIGAGGLGCPALQYLSGSGIGKIGIADFDKVSASNLHRQTIYSYADIGKQKCEAAAEFIRKQNPFIEAASHKILVNETNISELIQSYDIIMDCTDNVLSKYLINDACVVNNKTLVYGSVFKSEGNVSVFNLSQDSPTLRCLFPETENDEMPNCERTGISGIVPGITGMLMANEALKIILKNKDVLDCKLLIFNASTSETKIISFQPHFKSREISLQKLSKKEPCTISVFALKHLMDINEDFNLIDVRTEAENEFCNIGGLLVPLDELDEHLYKLDKLKKTIIYCHHGIRSLNAVEYLKDLGYNNMLSLEGGIHAWALEIDSKVNVY